MFVLSDSESGVRINNIWVFDGPDRRLMNQALSGYNGAFGSAITWSNPRDRTNVWTLSTATTPGPDVLFGIAIAVFVFFTGNESLNQIVFRAAGADFDV